MPYRFGLSDFHCLVAKHRISILPITRPGLTALACGLFFLALTGSISAQQPIAHYKFDNTAEDFSGNKNHGIIHGNVKPVMDRFGNPCGAYAFDGQSGYIEVPPSVSLDKPQNTLTMTCWYRFSSKRLNYWLTVLCKGASNHETSDNPQYRFQVQQHYGASAPKCPQLPGGGFATVSLNTAFTACDPDFVNHPLNPFAWSFFAVVYSGTKVTAYLNDNKIFESDFNGSFGQNNSAMYIGLDEPGMTEYFDGALDDIYVFDDALGEQDILKLYKESRPADWQKKPLTVSWPPDITATVPAALNDIKVNFAAPKVVNNGCGDFDVKQIAGQSPGSSFTPGRHLIIYHVSAANSYQEDVGFYINVKKDNAIAKAPSNGQTVIFPQKPANPPVAPAPAPVKSTPRKDTAIITPAPPQAKKDTIKKSPPRDTAVLAKLTKRETIAIKEIELESDSVKIVMYDNAQYDGDTVSIYLNDRLIISRTEVTTKGVPLFIRLDPTVDNRLVMFAENLGSIPPNTALLVVHDKSKKVEIHMSSSLTQNAMIILRKKTATKK